MTHLRTLTSQFLRRIFFVSAAALGVLGCGGGGDPTGPVENPPAHQPPAQQPPSQPQAPTIRPVAALTLSPGGLQGQVGQGGQLTPTLTSADGTILTGRTISWTTSDAAVASVSSTGWVTAVGVGTTQVTATSEGKSASVSIVVSVTREPVARVVVSPADSYGYVGDSGPFTASVRDAAGNELTDRAVIWQTSNAGVASVSAAGVVTAVGVGTAVVSAASEGVVGLATVTVIARPTAPPPPSTNVCSAISGAELYADDGQYLGKITGRYNSESIFSSFGTYGSKYSATSIWNEYGKYGGAYGQFSPFNRYSSSPPVIVKNGVAIAYLTINTTKSPRVTPTEVQACDF